MKVGRNDEEEYVLDEDINKEMDVREHDKPLNIDNTSGDDDKEEADDGPYTEFSYEPTEQHDKNVYVPPIGDAASEGHDEVGNVHKPDTETVNNSTKSGGPYEEPMRGLIMPKHMMRNRPLSTLLDLPIRTAK
jgi:hypothetical protein